MLKLENRAEDLPFWSALERFDASALSSGARASAGARWAKSAQAEHASIASFSRFSLQLVGVAAPPSLIAAAHEAAIDEIHHARLSFALASRLLGEPLGPGPLPLDGDLIGDVSLVTIAAETFRDGCVNETIAAAEARTAGEEASHEVIRAAMRVIERDEQRHAELAWTFVGWAVATGGAPVRDAIASASSAYTIADAPAEPGFVAGLGHLDGPTATRVRRDALRELIAPAVYELLGHA